MFQLKKPVVISVLIRLAATLPRLPFQIAAGLPACSINDPSYSSTTSVWVNDDGQGFYAGSDCSNGGTGSEHCWCVISLKLEVPINDRV